MKKQDTTWPASMPKDVAVMVAAGDVVGAMERWGKAYSLTGIVVEGNKIGRTLGYPTANLQPFDHAPVLPGQGVYTAMVYVEEQWHRSMVNVGIRPTLNLKQVTIEAHLFNFHGNIYGQSITIHFLEKIRDEMRFSSLSELQKQLHADKQDALVAINSMMTACVISNNEVLLLKSS